VATKKMITIKKEHFYRKEYDSLRGLIDMLIDMPHELRGQPMLEIGAHIGDSTEIFSMFFSPVYTIDPFTVKIYDKFKEKTNHLSNIKPITGYSETSYKLIPDDLAFVYIDGKHTYDQVALELLLYFPKIRKGGVIGGHDYKLSAFPGVVQAINEKFGEPDRWYIDSSWIVRKA
jgi:hypothetical protein